MTAASSLFKDVTLLVTHYNRSSSLKRLLESFRTINFEFGDIVVSDDGSKPEHVAALHELQETISFRLIKAHRNKGLGNNINKGQDAVKTPYTLYVQEDFVPKPLFAVRFRDALSLMKERSDLDIVRFYAYFKYPNLKPVRNGFSEMIFSPFPWHGGYRKFYSYSDHPHLRRSTFLAKFGRYQEGIKGDAGEYKMMMSFLQKKGKGLFYEDFQDLFDQKNSEEEPSTMKREYWRQTENPLISFVRHIYRHMKFNFDLYFSK